MLYMLPRIFDELRDDGVIIVLTPLTAIMRDQVCVTVIACSCY